MGELGFEGWLGFRSQDGEEHDCIGGRNCKGKDQKAGNPSSLFWLEVGHGVWL